jgi:hypothetical protein
LLERLGHSAHLVDNGAEALRAAQLHLYDLVLMDVHMPLMDGVSATRAIRALPGEHGQTCIVALTADVFGDTRERCLSAGAAEVVTKPVSLPMLQTLLDRHFGADAPPRAACAATTEATGIDDTGSAGGLLDAQVVNGVRELMAGSSQPSLYDTFFGQASRAASRMREAMREADPEALRSEAHAIKGAALNLGLAALADAAARLSREATSMPAAELALAVQRFEELTDATRALCRFEGLLTP